MGDKISTTSSNLDLDKEYMSLYIDSKVQIKNMHLILY